MPKLLLTLLIAALPFFVCAQKTATLSITLHSPAQQPLPHATLSLMRTTDSVVVHTRVTDPKGQAFFPELQPGSYLLKASLIGYQSLFRPLVLAEGQDAVLTTLTLQPDAATLSSVTVTARKPMIELQPDKTVVNLDASVTAAGTSVMEALEKMPGVTVNKDGIISLKGRSGVLVLIDGKQTYLDAAALANLLQGMSAAQVSQVELMDQPSARYDAAGNAGIINIRTKKNRQRGFNGSINTAFTQGFYPKTSNSIQLNYRNGRFNYFLTYSLFAAQQFTRIEALRRYYNGTAIGKLLDQPSFLAHRATNHTLRTGMDYEWSKKTTVGMVLSGTGIKRRGDGANEAYWMNAGYRVDSLIRTTSTSTSSFRNGGINFNLRHQFDGRRELTADLDGLSYQIDGTQAFNNQLVFPGSYTEASRADLPSRINILSAKADYSQQVGEARLEGGWKSSFIRTDNEAAYQYRDGSQWKEDLGKSNHFRYNENINALYGNVQGKRGRWDLQGGLRFEMTHYDARQLGNAAQKDSSFSRSYNSLFPSLFAGYALDSNNRFTLSTGRRIDRPAFQKLNPFLFIINKYTYQQGNPYYRPQYTWNVELEHQYKNLLTTGISYSITTDYFAQIFPISTNGIVIYTEGNLDKLQTWGASVGINLSPARWWSLNGQAIFNHKKMEGFVGRALRADINQLNFNLNNQFRFKKGWSGELTGFYTSRSQHDIQEIVDPAGQVAAGVAKQVWQQKGTVKLAVRDIFYTQWMKGNTYFQEADEYFKLTRDTRVATLSFTYRFGKALKTARRSDGAAGEEKARVGTGN